MIAAAVDGSFTKVLPINKVQYHVQNKKCPRGPWSYTMCLSLAESQTASLKNVSLRKRKRGKLILSVTVG